MRQIIALTLAAFTTLAVPTWISYPATVAAETATAQFIATDKDDAAWDGAQSHSVGERGSFKLLWDGSALHVRVTSRVTADAVSPWSFAGGTDYPRAQDFIAVGFDVYGDRFNFETDTAGWFLVLGDGTVKTFSNAMIPSLSSPWNENSPEYSDRVSASAAVADGDTRVYDITLQLEAVGREYPSDGDVCALEVAIHDGAGDGWSYWSHSDASLYALPDHERARAVDWGLVTLAGYNGEPVLSAWRALEAIRWYESKSNPGDNVWRADTLAAFKDAVAEITTGLITTKQADKVWDAYLGLRWADTKYPDPLDLPRLNTLPSPYQFFNSERTVETFADWQERRAELLDLAQFYEYGYKPTEGVVEIRSVEATQPKGTYKVTYAVTANGSTVETYFNITLPSDENMPLKGAAVVIGETGTVGDNIAGVSAPTEWTTDDRSDAVAWGNRNAFGFDFGTFTMREMGLFYKLFPYARNSTSEVSAEMAYAYGVSRVIDALELLTVEGSPHYLHINAEQIAARGFSINGKYTFVAALFDERISVCIPGASGASGVSPWRYTYVGHEYDWTDTPFYSTDASAHAVATGTEFMGNSIRHNRVRETELFRRFLNPGHMYEHEDGAFGYGTRLPYDQNDLLATLAPRAVIVENTVNDYNDGSESDALSMELAKSVYRALGYDGDELLRFNYGKYAAFGDPHGQVGSAANVAAYLRHYFYGEALDPTIDETLRDNPFMRAVSNGATPYDYYYGGFSAITGGVGDGDGWYYHAAIPLVAAEPTQSAVDSVHAPAVKSAGWLPAVIVGGVVVLGGAIAVAVTRKRRAK
ncbi:MAG: CBM9 family sugar-binding protein [Oscillospiraceae bacterium]|jgi:hypothetical protein|nr:CBM9 family sugar-binding protein [Oscillospiraceae bacterium]